MLKANEKIISILEALVEICKDGNQGYKDAADDVSDKELTRIFTEYSVQREKFMYELQDIVKKLGGEVEFKGSILGILHRRWMDVRFGIAGNNAESILKECLRGEKSAMSRYKEVLGSDLPDNIKTIVNYQFEEIKEAHDNIKRFIELAQKRVLDT